MDTIHISKNKLGIIISDMEKMVSDFESLVEFDDLVVDSRLHDIKSGKVKGIKEKELDKYLSKRGVKVD
ncbi:MAG: hypothetical protein ABH950_03790 [Candidatus Altiarchaeota archaeon]